MDAHQDEHGQQFELVYELPELLHPAACYCRNYCQFLYPLIISLISRLTILFGCHAVKVLEGVDESGSVREANPL